MWFPFICDCQCSQDMIAERVDRQAVSECCRVLRRGRCRIMLIYIVSLVRSENIHPPDFNACG